MSETPTLVDRLKHLMSDRLESGDEYSSEVAGRAADRIRALEAEVKRLKAELTIKTEFLRTRQCPDHSGKWERGRCLQCEVERLQTPRGDKEIYCWNCGWPVAEDAPDCPNCEAPSNEQIVKDAINLQEAAEAKLAAIEGVQRYVIDHTLPYSSRLATSGSGGLVLWPDIRAILRGETEAK